MFFRMVGVFVALPIVAPFARGLPGPDGAWAVGMAVGAYGITQAAMQIPVGALADRVGRKPALALALVVFIAGESFAPSPIMFRGSSPDDCCKARGPPPPPSPLGFPILRRRNNGRKRWPSSGAPSPRLLRFRCSSLRRLRDSWGPTEFSLSPRWRGRFRWG